MRVSAIMPTRGMDRRNFAIGAVQAFLTQGYSNRDLLILDEEKDPTFTGNGFDIARSLREMGKNAGAPINYWRWYSEPMNIPQKRNFLCARAPGDLIAHWDSDDWSGPDRIQDQVARLLRSGLDVTGYHDVLFYDQDKDLAYQYRSHKKTYAVGTSLMFFPSWWKNNMFREDKNIGEDNEFVFAADREKRIVCAPGGAHIVARIHSGNTCKKTQLGCSFVPVHRDMIPAEFF